MQDLNHVPLDQIGQEGDELVTTANVTDVVADALAAFFADYNATKISLASTQTSLSAALTEIDTLAENLDLAETSLEQMTTALLTVQSDIGLLLSSLIAKTKYTYDGQGRVQKIEEQNAMGTVLFKTEYTYNATTGLIETRKETKGAIVQTFTYSYVNGLVDEITKS